LEDQFNLLHLGGGYRGWVGVVFGRGSSIFEDMEDGLEMLLVLFLTRDLQTTPIRQLKQ